MPNNKKSSVKIGIVNHAKVTNAASDNGALDLYFLDYLYNSVEFDWWSGTIEETNLVADVISQVKAAQPTVINLFIDCLGGDASIGISLYNFLKNFPAKVFVEIIGFCGSAATILAQSASKGKRKMPKNGFFITHEAEGTVSGRSKDMRAGADVVDKYTDQIGDILSQNNTASKTKDEVLALWVDGDCWMTGSEALEFGFVDEVYNEVEVTNRVAQVTAEYNVPDRIKAMLNAPVSDNQEDTEEIEPTDAQHQSKIEKVLNNIAMDFKKHMDAFTNKLKGQKVSNAITGDNLQTEVTNLVAEPLSELMNGLQTEVTNEIKTFKDDVKNDIETAVDNRYKDKITELENAIKGLQDDARDKAGSEAGTKTGTENTVTKIGKGHK